MKTIDLFLLACIGFSLLGCNKNDDSVPPEIELQNEPPLSFNLIEVRDGATEVDVQPTFSWEAAIDPDGHAVKYTVLIGKSINDLQPYSSDILATQYTPETRLSMYSEYFWKVRAEDGKNGEVESDIYRFKTRGLKLTNVLITDNAAFSRRSSHTSVVFQDRIWVIGGIDGESKNDVWFSSDGLNWTSATTDAEFSPRSGHSSVVFQNKIWVIGGSDGERKNDVWYSEDGIRWNQATALAPFSPRFGHSSLVFEDKIWIIGGHIGSPDTAEIWHSSDGISWVEAPKLPFERFGHTSVVFENKMWIIGGSNGNHAVNESWYSTDGQTWTKTNSSSPLRSRSLHTSTVFDGMIWTIGGSHFGAHDDIFYSSDGIDWTRIEGDMPFSRRTRHTSVMFNDSLWMIGGYEQIGPTYPNPPDHSGPTKDVWAFN